jgi:UDP-N-acetylmuramoyl-tripeptide--D-alanyl-D-alanine ligase
MDIAELASAINATLISFCAEGAGFSSVQLDSRSVSAGALFVALAGARVDGHCYVRVAFENGAAAALVNRSALEDTALALIDHARFFHASLLVVDNTLSAFQDAARVYLAQFPQLLKIGITGSSGKTTTKEIAAAMIGQEKSVVMNEGNLNSETGLPLSVFKVRSHHAVGIFEMGMNRRGEIAELARIVQPHIALITNIGSAHVGMLGSRQAIACEKKAIFSRFTGTETALIPADDEYAAFLAEHVSGAVFYGESSFPELGAVRDQGLDGTDIEWDSVNARFTLPGRHNVKNALAAAAIARSVPVAAASIRRGLASLTPLFGRGELLRGPITVIRDCYNANPESMDEAIRFCDHVAWTGRRVYVIGSMLELGAASVEAHERLGKTLTASRADFICLFGREMAAAARVLAASGGDRKISVIHTDDINTLAAEIARLARHGDLILLKGSRGCSLERLCPVLGH